MSYLPRIVLYTILQLAPMITFAGKLFASDSKWSERPGWWTVWIPFLLDIAKSIFLFCFNVLQFIVIWCWPVIIIICGCSAYRFYRDSRDPSKH